MKGWWQWRSLVEEFWVTGSQLGASNKGYWLKSKKVREGGWGRGGRPGDTPRRETLDHFAVKPHLIIGPEEQPK